MSRIINLFVFATTVFLTASCQSEEFALAPTAPNILVIIADDWSYPHAGVYGDTVVKTPNFDRVATEGVFFEHAFVSSPSCTPSRAAVLTGQHFWRLEEGANLYGPLDPEYPTYTDLLATAGYHVGYTQKGWGPGEHEDRPHNPAGKPYDSFLEFLSERPDSTPFCFWFGSHNPHRGYEKGSGEAAGIAPEKIQLPGCFPESDTIRRDMADYYLEVQAFDDQIGALLAQLDTIEELDNTIIVVTSDNGMPFPRCKSNVYDMGTRVPLAIRWGNDFEENKPIPDFVSLTDLAPTFLKAAHLPLPGQMTGESLLLFLDPERVEVITNRDQVFFGKERHVPGQELGDWGGYPSRAIRTEDFLYIKNFRPDRWPAGTPNYQEASFYPAYYADVDGGPTRTYMIENQNKDSLHRALFSLAFAKRPAEELYDLNNDPDQLHNVAEDPAFATIKSTLEEQLMKELVIKEDPRVVGNEEIFEPNTYTGGGPLPDHFQWRSNRYATVTIDSFPSEHISTRSVEVLVPVNVHYDETFPVLYMFDGQNLFDSFTGWEGELNPGWRVHEVLDSLNEAETIPQVIVVGIHNSGDRMSEYMPEKPEALVAKRVAETDHEWYQSFKTNPPKASQQLRFIVEELKPHIDSQFKTKKDRANTFIAGASMGGLLSAYAICEYPEVFGGAACFSTHWPPLDGVFLEYLKENLPDPATHQLYFDHGTEGLDGEYEPFQKVADQALEARGYVSGKNWVTRKFEGADHNEKDWHARFHIPMEFLLGEE